MAADHAVAGAPPWSRRVRLAEADRGVLTLELEADAAALGRIARALDLPQVEILEATVRVTPWLDGVELRGDWRARVVQTCGVTLEPFAGDLADSFQVKAVPPGSPHAPADLDGEAVLDLDAPDPPDVLDGDFVDVAAYVVEHLGLALDPYPRKPGAEFEQPPEPPETSPFAALANLKIPHD